MTGMAYIAIILIQGASLPLLVDAIQNGAIVPPLMPAMLASGLFMLLLHSIHYKMRVYVVSNSFGLFFNLALLVVSL